MTHVRAPIKGSPLVADGNFHKNVREGCQGDFVRVVQRQLHHRCFSAIYILYRNYEAAESADRAFEAGRYPLAKSSLRFGALC